MNVDDPLTPRHVAVLDAASAGVTAALLILAAAGVAGPARLLLALAFVTFVPGWALLGHLPLAHGVALLALVVALSLTICTTLAQSLLWLRWWNPGAMLAVLAAVSLAVLMVQLAAAPLAPVRR